MLTYNTLRFGTDTFTLDRQGLLIAKTPLDASNVTSVTGITVDGAQPANTERRFAFKIDGALKKFSGSDLVALSGGETFDNVIANGNTAAELAALTNIPAFVGQKIYPLIALKATADASEMPTAKLALNCVVNTEQFTKTVETAETTLTGLDGATPTIVSVVANKTCTGAGSVDVTVALLNGNTWSEYIALDDAAGQSANAVKFKIVYTVASVGSDSAKLNSITIRYNMGETTVMGETAEIVSVTQNFEEDLQTCYLVVRHAPLFDSQLKAYVSFGTAPKYREPLTLGTGTGKSANYNISKTTYPGLHPSTLRVYVDGKPVTEFGYSTYYNRITLKAPKNSVVAASFEYGWGEEVWREMECDIDQQPYPDGSRMTRFAFALTDEEAENMQVTNVRLVMTRPTGSVENKSMGTATGKTQMIVLLHYAEQSTIKLNADWSYDPDNKILTYIAPKGTALTISYDWVGEQVTIYSWAAGWNAAT